MIVVVNTTYYLGILLSKYFKVNQLHIQGWHFSIHLNCCCQKGAAAVKFEKKFFGKCDNTQLLTVCILYVSSKRDLLQRSQGVVLNKWKKEGQRDVTMYLEEVVP